MKNIKWKAALLAVVLLVAMLAAPVTAAPALTVERADYLVGFHGPPSRALVEQFGGQVYAEFTIVDAIAVRLPTQAVTALEKNPRVAYVEPDAEVFALEQTVPWGIDRVFGDEIYSFPAWTTSTGSGIGVAVLDTGIGPHGDLVVKGGVRYYTQGIFFPRLYEDNKYQDGHGHGTHVAGTIAALDNSIGVVGVAPQAELYAVKVLTDSGSGSTTAIIAGIEWVIKNAQANNMRIINMSLGSSAYSETFKNACDKAYQEGILVVSSAGNSGNADGTGDNVGYPAKYDSVIAVAASDSSDQRAYFSSTGAAVELIAPGVSVLSTVLNNGYAAYNGTSMASPHVAGVAALVWAADSRLTNAQVREVLSGTAQDLKLLANHQGKGLVRADLAVAAVMGDPPPATITYTINAAAGVGGSINPSGDIEVSGGKNQTFSITPDTGYEIADVSVDGTSAGSVTSYTFESVTSDHTINAGFARKTYNLSYTPGNNGTLKGNTTQTVNHGDSGTSVEAVPDGGYVFDRWSDGSISNPRTDTNVTSDISVTALFKVEQGDPPPAVIVISEISYSTTGGRLNDRHLQVSVWLVDGAGSPVPSASVSITLNLNATFYSNSSGTTGSNGSVTFSYNNAPSGTYTTKVDNVTATGLTWNEITPKNTFTK